MIIKIKQALRWLLPTLFLLCICIGSYKCYVNSQAEVYTFSIQSKWRSTSVSKHSVSEYHNFDMCLVSYPEICINSFSVRENDWHKYDKGDILSYKLSRDRVYPNSAFVSVFGTIGFILFFFGAIVGFFYGGYRLLAWVYDWDIGTWRSGW